MAVRMDDGDDHDPIFHFGIMEHVGEVPQQRPTCPLRGKRCEAR